MSAVGSAASASVLAGLGLEVRDEALERVLAAVEDEVVGELALLVGDLAVRRDVVRVDHREVEPGLHAVVQEDGVEHRARGHGRCRRRRWRRRARSCTPGSSALISRMPSIVSTADGFHSSSPVVSVKVSASKISSSRVHPVLVADQVVDARARPRACARASWPCRPRRSSARSARRRAPWRSGRRVSSLSRPASRLTELTIARPGIWSSAVSITSGSVESTWIGAGWVSETFLATRRICSSSSWRSVSATQRSSTWAPPSTWSSATCDEPVVVVGEQQLLGLARALRVHALADERRARAPARAASAVDHRARRAAGAAPGAARRRAAVAALLDRADVLGRRAAAAADDARRRSARRTRRARRRAARARSGKIVSPFGPWCGMPAFGMQWTGSGRVLAEEADRRRACPPGRWSS